MGKGGNSPFPPLVLSAGQIFKSVGVRLTKRKSNLISWAQGTPHT